MNPEDTSREMRSSSHRESQIGVEASIMHHSFWLLNRATLGVQIWESPIALPGSLTPSAVTTPSIHETLDCVPRASWLNTEHAQDSRTCHSICAPAVSRKCLPLRCDSPRHKGYDTWRRAEERRKCTARAGLTTDSGFVSLFLLPTATGVVG